MTRAQYDAICMIAEHGEKIKANELNIRPQTMAALILRQWVEVTPCGYAMVMPAAWGAVK